MRIELKYYRIITNTYPFDTYSISSVLINAYGYSLRMYDRVFGDIGKCTSINSKFIMRARGSTY